MSTLLGIHSALGLTAQPLQTVGTRTATRKPWLSTETLAIIDLKAEARRNNNQAEQKRLQSTFRAKEKADQESFLNKLADEVNEGLRSNHYVPCIQSHQNVNRIKGDTCYHHSQPS